MSVLRSLAVAIAAVVVAGPAAAQRFEPRSFAGLTFFKGNTHTHTAESDGDSSPEVVAAWYKRHGYRFLVLSDHNVFTDPARLASMVDSSFLLIPGEELTSQFQRRPVHVNGLSIPGRIEPRVDSTLVGTIQKNVDAVREVKGVPHINHPNFGWAFGARELVQIRNDPLLEIFNGHPLVHNHGGDDTPGMEQVWDELLTAGKRIFGIAVDDAHHFQGEFSADRSNPGRGWIAIAATRLVSSELMASLEAGRFYASSGVTLDSIRVGDASLEIAVRPVGNFKYTTTFIGDGGRVLATVGGRSPSYRLRPADRDLRYVRARVDDSGGGHAWVQPVFLVR